MRHLPTKRSHKQKVIIGTCMDYYGPGASQEELKSSKKVALWIMGRKKRLILSEDEKLDVWFIKTNLDDTTYANSFAEQTPGTPVLGI